MYVCVCMYMYICLCISMYVSMYIYVYISIYRPSFLSQRFRTLIHPSKGLYSITLLSSLCVPWVTGAFWHCFTSSTVVSWYHFCYITQLHRVSFSQWILTHFFMTFIQLCIDVWSSQPPVTQAGQWNSHLFLLIWAYSPTFGFVLSCFLMFLRNIIHCSSGNFFSLLEYPFFKEEKCLQINFSKDSWLY